MLDSSRFRSVRSVSNWQARAQQHLHYVRARSEKVKAGIFDWCKTQRQQLKELSDAERTQRITEKVQEEAQKLQDEKGEGLSTMRFSTKLQTFTEHDRTNLSLKIKHN
jgi:23S rRNA pseudoU1915 N3-methylase RlmH